MCVDYMNSMLRFGRKKEMWADVGEKMCGSPVLQGAYAERARVGICRGYWVFFCS